jgi:hypothetical protein
MALGLDASGSIVSRVGTIYLRHGDRFVAMHEDRYEGEEVLQALLAEHPEVLAGDQSDDDGRGWVFVKREAGVAVAEEASARFSLDHLFLDAKGIPTLVEVKRSSDTRARREVVAQMLDYAANATAFWKVEQLQAWFDAECARNEADPAEELNSKCGVLDTDAYWERVGTNLAASRIRLVFVADEIAPELRSIVEFLNRQMTETEVLAVEVKQYVDANGERHTFVPRVIGQREVEGAAKRPWDKESLIEEIARRYGDVDADIARRLIEWAEAHEGMRVEYGEGAHEGSAAIWLDRDGACLRAFFIWTYDKLEIPFGFMGVDDPFRRDRALRDELRRRLNEAIPDASIPDEDKRRRPSFTLSALRDDSTRQAFFGAIEWAFDQAVAAKVEAANRPAP